jgi:VWFA-related protein
MRPFMRVGAVVGLVCAALAVCAPQQMAVGQTTQDLVINYVAPPVPNPAAQNNEVRAYFSVLDADRRPVPGLTPDAIGVSLFGRPITGFELSQPQDPMAIILVIDTSGSMSGQPLEQAKAAAKQFIDTLAAQDEVALFSFNLTVTNHTPDFTVDKSAIKNLIGSSELAVPKDGTGWTCLYDALYDAVTLAVKRPQGRGAIVVLSDGADIAKDKKPCSRHNAGDVVDRAQSTLMPIYTIGLGQADRVTLEKFAYQTGGQALISPQPDDLAQAFQDLGHLLKDQYRLAFKTDLSGSGALQISLKSDPKAIADAQITLVRPDPLPLPPGPGIAIEGQSQVVEGALVFTVSFQTGPANSPVREARWYVDNGLMGVITDVQHATHQLTYRVNDSAGQCLVGDHELRIEAINAAKGESQHSADFTIVKEMCPAAPPPGQIWIVLVAVVALAALVGVFVVMRRQAKVQTGGMPDNLSEKTEEEPAEIGLVARLRLMGGARTADNKTELAMTTDTFRIGRGADNDLCLEDKKVSRKHAEIHFNSVTRTFTLFDRNSTGGTRVNDKFIKASSAVLTNNATIVVGSANILFEVTRGGDPTRGSIGGTTEDDDRTEMEP